MSGTEHSAEIDVTAEVVYLRGRLADETAAKRTAADSADRFRDVLSECLGHPDENPGDDVLVAELREHFGKTGPEPTRWRDFCTGALSIVDQINADNGRPPECTCPPGGGLPLCAYVTDDDLEDESGWRPVRFGCVTPPVEKGNSDA